MGRVHEFNRDSLMKFENTFFSIEKLRFSRFLPIFDKILDLSPNSQ